MYFIVIYLFILLGFGLNRFVNITYTGIIVHTYVKPGRKRRYKTHREGGKQFISFYTENKTL